MHRVVTFGELLLSLGAKGNGRLVQAEEFTARYTGAEANVAVSLAQFGVEAFVVSKVPAHEIGQACINALRRFGVRTEHIVPRRRSAGTSLHRRPALRSGPPR